MMRTIQNDQTRAVSLEGQNPNLRTTGEQTTKLITEISKLKFAVVDGVEPAKAASDAAKRLMAGKPVKIVRGKQWNYLPGYGRRLIQCFCAVQPQTYVVRSLEEFRQANTNWERHKTTSFRVSQACDYNSTYRSPTPGL